MINLEGEKIKLEDFYKLLSENAVDGVLRDISIKNGCISRISYG